MAKASSPSSGTSRIRFIMLEAELPSGDIQQVTQAIQNALRPATTIVQQRLGPATNGNGADVVSSHNGIIDGDVLAAEAEDVEYDVPPPSPKPAKTSKARVYRTPNVLELDLTSPLSWEEFSSQRQPESDADKFLTVAAWFKECRGEDAVTVDHIYTCFRAVNWSTSIEDFSGPLRYLKSQRFMSTPERGKYAINHLGIARVNKMAGR